MLSGFLRRNSSDNSQKPSYVFGSMPPSLPRLRGLQQMLKTSKHDCVRLSQPLQSPSHRTVENIYFQTIIKRQVVRKKNYRNTVVKK